jgi:uncharacterized OsmC-like protein
MSETVHVSHLGGDRFEITVRQHHLEVDQPLSDGGEDQAPTPTELFVSSLAACVAFYARRYLARHDLPTDDLAVHANFTMASRPARVGQITLHIALPAGIPEDKRDALLAVATHCTIHNTLNTPPKISLDLTSLQEAAA